MNLGFLRRSTHSPAEKNTERGFLNALALFHSAAERIPAYKDFLHREKCDPTRIRTQEDFLSVPLTDKENYVSRYSLAEMSWDGVLSPKYISSSSGSTGVPFFWPRGGTQDVIINTLMQPLFEEFFETKKGKTLFVNSFALGTWIAGLEFYNTAKWAIEQGNPMTIVTPGIEEAEAIRAIQKLAPLFTRVILGGYPPFLKDIIERGAEAGISWSSFDTRLMPAGEAISEPWRDGMLKRIGKEGALDGILNVYGMAEAGIVAHETPLSLALRRRLPTTDKETGFPPADQVIGVYQYRPELRYFESVAPDSLVLTTDAGLPLIRYNTRDSGGILTFTEGMGAQKIAYPGWDLPFVYLFGRKDLSISFYALNIYVENIKHSLEGSPYDDSLSGLFTMSVGQTENLDQTFNITLELDRGIEAHGTLLQDIKTLLMKRLPELNSEYARLVKALGTRAEPHITLVPYGEIDTVLGRKHKWVKRA